MPRLLIISFSPVASEPRVIRQSSYFISKGFKVTVAGFAGKDRVDDRWDFIDLSNIHLSTHWNIKRFFNAILYRLYNYLPFVYSFPERKYWINKFNKRVEDYLSSYCCSDLIICHDYYTAPIAYNLGKKFGARVIIDVHEHALSQFKTDKLLPNLRWFFINRPYVHAIQKKFFNKFWAITTVCQGIARDLKDVYSLKEMPRVIRSIPFYTSVSYREVSQDCVKILYHGILNYGRGIEEYIAALSFLPKKFYLTLQGFGDPNYINTLVKLIQNEQLEDRIKIKPAVNFSEIVNSANQHDIGIFVIKDWGLQKRYVLPNKFFEYIMAGLALCVSDLPEMSKIVKQYDLGILVPNGSPQAIANALNSLTNKKINSYKTNSLTAAKDLNWESESKKLDFISNLKEKNHASHY